MIPALCGADDGSLRGVLAVAAALHRLDLSARDREQADPQDRDCDHHLDEGEARASLALFRHQSRHPPMD